MTDGETNRAKQVLLGAVILGTILVGAVTLLLGWHHVPGLLGEWLGVIAGMISTPFFLEATFVVMGALIVVGLNSWRRTKDGEEFVYLEQVTGPGAKELPDHAKWAVYQDKPLPPGSVSLLERAEGAVAIGDFESAAALLATMSHEELAADGALEVRLALAEAAGKHLLAERLRGEIRQSGRKTT